MYYGSGGHVSPAVTHHSQIWSIPDHVSPVAISGLVLTQVGYNCAMRSAAAAGDAVVIIGDGLIGHWAAQTLRGRGARVLLAGRHDARLRFLHASEHDRTVNVQQDDPVDVARVYIFGAFLIFTGVKMAMHRNAELHPERNPVVRLFQRLIPVTDAYEGERFLIHRAGRWMATPLFLVLVMVESTDLIFAVDSIPAIFAVTDDPFLVYNSNVFAILGLRSLYFGLAGVIDRFHYLKLGLSAVLSFVGVKMVLVDIYKIPVLVSLGVIATILTVVIGASRLRAPRHPDLANEPSPVISP